MEGSSKALKIIIGLLIFTVIMIALWIIDSRIKFSGLQEFEGFMTTRISKSEFDRYATTMTKSDDGYYLTFKDVQGSAGGEIYYNLDLTFDANSAGVASAMQKNQAYTVLVIREAISQLSDAEFSSESGREQIKRLIKNSLSEAYKTDGIKDVYIEKFLYQKK